MAGRKLVCNSEVSTGAHTQASVGSAFPMSMVLTGNDRGNYGTSPLITGESKMYFDTESGITCISGKTADYSKILLSYDYIASNMFGRVKEKGVIAAIAEKASQSATSDKAPKVSLNTLLGPLFGDIYHATGGLVQLATMEDINDPKNLNVIPKNAEMGDLTPIVFDPINGDGVTRKCTVKCDIPADDAYAVANGGAAGGSGHTSSLIAEEETEPEPDPLEEAEKTVTKMMETGISANDFDNEDCEALAAAFKTIVDKSGPTDAAEQPHDKNVFPLELAIEIDGASGFRFGDVVTSTFMPKRYRDSKVGFVAIEVSHNISGNDWVTSITTQCYLGK